MIEGAPLCLVGMSGVGKSFWARRLEARGFVRHDCDGEIAGHLAELVAPGPGEEPVHALGRWMGMPWEPGYAGREARYLALEEQVTRAALDACFHEATGCSAGAGHVLDATGSVIYLSPALLGELRARCRVVYLSTPDARRQRMLERYLEEPKPVVWGGVFEPAPGEPPATALPRCYPALLSLRDARYRSLAHVVLDGGELETSGASLDEFLARCQR
jgi:dephospho-CoA kinase